MREGGGAEAGRELDVEFAALSIVRRDQSGSAMHIP